ncbi:Vesicular inhibitory amino acid transporter [Stylophora pistillata]|uniref:Vesicular inhibitory amino acid transporter n=1 Tax=Stylophora pistillata TaxID=50429 RepID=A0A2B4SU85_STYPI|nr:Vesicular inhibitory amino acid transporter [Stylophora pistillata]
MTESRSSSPLLGKESKSGHEGSENELENKNSSLEAFFNIFNANMGTGVLAMPYVIRLAGYWGVILIIIIAALGNYTGKLLIYCLREDTAYENLSKATYADLGEAFWPRYGRVMVHITNFFEQFSHCTLFLIMCGTVLHHTFPDSFVSESVWIAVVSIAVLPCAGVRTMKHISWISILTVIVALVTSTSVLVFALGHFHQWRTHELAPLKFKEMSIAMGIIVVTYSSQAYLPIIEKSMRYPGEFNAIMDFTYTVVTIIKFNYGILVFFCFREHTEQIMTLSVPHVGCVCGVVFSSIQIAKEYDFYRMWGIEPDE